MSNKDCNNDNIHYINSKNLCCVKERLQGIIQEKHLSGWSIDLDVLHHAYRMKMQWVCRTLGKQRKTRACSLKGNLLQEKEKRI